MSERLRGTLQPHILHSMHELTLHAVLHATSGLASSPALATVSFTNVQNNAVVESPVHLEFAVEGLTVKPAGALGQTGKHAPERTATCSAHSCKLPLLKCS